MLSLHPPHISLFPSFMEFVEEMRANKEELWAPYLPAENERPQEFVDRLNRRAHDPEPPFVPESIYWAVLSAQENPAANNAANTTVVGRISLRHRLEGNLHKMGGHIGYEVRPSFRCRGFAKEMLRQILLTPKAREIGELLLTCSPNNPASSKTIVANGGVFTKTIFVEQISDERSHYWIKL